MKENRKLYYSEIEEEILKEFEEINLEKISNLLILDVSINEEDNICLKFAKYKFYSKKYKGDEEKIFYGSKEKEFVPCVRATDENIDKVREILISQVLSFAEYSDIKREKEIFKGSFSKVGIPCYLLTIITAGVIANPLISISFALLTTAVTCIDYINCSKESKIEKTETPYAKFNTICNEYRKEQEQSNEYEKNIDKDFDNVSRVVEERLSREDNSKNKVKVKRK